MDSTAHEHAGRPVSGGTPQLECQSCRFPMIIIFVEQDGAERWIDCPYCGRHDSWTVNLRP